MQRDGIQAVTVVLGTIFLEDAYSMRRMRMNTKQMLFSYLGRIPVGALNFTAPLRVPRTL